MSEDGLDPSNQRDHEHSRTSETPVYYQVADGLGKILQTVIETCFESG